MNSKEIDRIECAIRHIETAVDVDPWAKDIAITAMKNMLANVMENHYKGINDHKDQNDESTIDNETPCVLFCNWDVANEFVKKDKNIEDCLVISSYLDDNEAIMVSKDDFLSWVRGDNDDTVSIQTYMQCVWERDTAIEQLRELGYGFGEKIRMDGDCVSRTNAVEMIESTTWYDPRDTDVAHEMIGTLPSVQPEKLTDKEQRIFLSAMGREEEVCKEVDDAWRDCKEQYREQYREPYEDSLVHVCKEIRRKVKGVLWT